MPVVARIRDHALRDEYARKLSGWVGAPDGSPSSGVRALAGARRTVAASAAPHTRPIPASRLGVPVHGDVDPQTLGLERDVLRVAVQRPALAGPAFDDLDPEAFLSPAYRALREAILKAGGCATQGGGQAWADALVAAASDDAAGTSSPSCPSSRRRPTMPRCRVTSSLSC